MHYSIDCDNYYVLKDNFKIFLYKIEFFIIVDYTFNNYTPEIAASFTSIKTEESKAEIVSYNSILPNTRLTITKKSDVENHININLSNLEGGPVDFNNFNIIFPEGIVVKKIEE